MCAKHAACNRPETGSPGYGQGAASCCIMPAGFTGLMKRLMTDQWVLWVSGGTLEVGSEKV